MSPTRDKHLLELMNLYWHIIIILYITIRSWCWTSQVTILVKNPTANAGDIREADLIFGSGRSSGGGHGNHYHILAWRIPWTEEPSGLQAIELQSQIWLKWLSMYAHCRFYVFGQMCSNIYLSLWHHTEVFIFGFPENHLCSIFILLFLQPLGSSDIFTVSIFLENCHIVEIVLYVAFLDWLFSLSSMHLISSISFPGLLTCLTVNNIPLWIYHSCFIHSPSEGHLGFFHVLPVWVKLI